jgi:hypothetical protein
MTVRVVVVPSGGGQTVTDAKATVKLIDRTGPTVAPDLTNCVWKNEPIGSWGVDAQIEPFGAGTTAGGAPGTYRNIDAFYSVLLNDGRVMVAFIEGGSIKRGYAPTAQAFIGASGSITDESVIAETVLPTGATVDRRKSSVSRAGGALWLMDDCTYSVAGTVYAHGRLLKSVDEGDTWTESRSDTVAPTGSTTYSQVAPAGPMGETSTGTLVYMGYTPWLYSGADLRPSYYFRTSTDGGATWVNRTSIGATGLGLGAVSIASRPSAFVEQDGAVYGLMGINASPNYLQRWRSTDGGTNWTQTVVNGLGASRLSYHAALYDQRDTACGGFLCLPDKTGGNTYVNLRRIESLSALDTVNAAVDGEIVLQPNMHSQSGTSSIAEYAGNLALMGDDSKMWRTGLAV